MTTAVRLIDLKPITKLMYINFCAYTTMHMEICSMCTRGLIKALPPEPFHHVTPINEAK